jgi:hypothetical protein
MYSLPYNTERVELVPHQGMISLFPLYVYGPMYNLVFNLVNYSVMI